MRAGQSVQNSPDPIGLGVLGTYEASWPVVRFAIAQTKSSCGNLRLALGWTVVALVYFVALAQAAWAEEPGSGEMVGELRRYEVTDTDTFAAIARQNGLGFVELIAANPGVDPWTPAVGTSLVLPTAHLLPEAQRVGIIVNLAEQRLYYFAGDGAEVATYPIGTGRSLFETPVGNTRVVRKRENPTWTPPASIRAERPDLPTVVPPGPDNPLGTLALDLSWSGYLIHGTINPLGIGRRVSHGCIRLDPADIRSLFDLVEVGTPVTIVDQPLKTARIRGQLYIEVHPTQAQADELEAFGSFTPQPLGDWERRITEAAGSQVQRINWPLITRAVKERRGIPIRVSH